MAYRTSDYSEFIGRLSALCGIDSTTLQTAELTNFNSFFNKNLRRIWRYTHWLENTITESRTPDSSYFIDYEQVGKTAIGEVFNVWTNNPLGTSVPRSVVFAPQATGIQLVGVTSASAVYVYYRTRIPKFAGATYSSASNYLSGTTVYFTASTGVSNYYTANQNVSNGLTPEFNPSYWTVSVLPYTFLEYVVFASYADFLRSDGQNDKAVQADSQADGILDDECDVLQRQQNFVPPTDFQTHLSSRPIF